MQAGINKKIKILFLYTEIAGYVVACLEKLCELHPNVEIHLVRYPVNKEAPFNFELGNRFFVYQRKEFNLKQLEELTNKICPSIIVCSGWIDKDYLKICKLFYGKCKTILTLDNIWKNTFKQNVARIISRISLLNFFHFCWVPGDPQYQYARRLGFKPNKILSGFYSADYDFFKKNYLENFGKKLDRFPHRFIYVGRYYEFKGIKDLWQAYIELKTEMPNDWELWCLGVGDIDPVEFKGIKHFGFIQPKEMLDYVNQTGVFILPSHKEPWGVVVHEFAISGFPLVCSDEVGAATTFIREEENGYIYKSGDVSLLKEKMKAIILKSDPELIAMGKASSLRSEIITPEIWGRTLLNVLN